MQLAVLVALLPIGACKPAADRATSPRADGPPTVYTTFYPTTYFAERIAGDIVKVVCPCPADADPAFWMPDEATIAAYQSADLILINGAAFEKWIGAATLPEDRIVETTKPLAAELIEIHDALTHSHGPAGAHTHAGTDGHTWVDPLNAKAQAQQIADAFARRWPAHADTFKKNMTALAGDLDKLHGRMAAVTAALQGRTLLCSHPAYNYLARRNGWSIVNFHLDPQEAPPADEVERIAKACGEHKVAAMLWEADPLPESTKLLRERFQVESVVFAPGEALDDAQRTAGVEYLSIMNANVDRLLAVLGAAPAGD